MLHVNLEIDENEPRSGILKLLQILRPEWNPQQVHMKPFTQGMTNRLIGCFLRPNQDQTQTSDSVLVRVYGRNTELYVDRSEEVQILRILEFRGLGSKIYCSFNNGICYEFLQGAPLTWSQVSQPHVYRLIAAEMARLHSIQFHSSESEPFLWKKMEHFLDLLQTSQSEHRMESCSQLESRENHSVQSENRWSFWDGPLPCPDVLRTEMELLKSRLSRLQSPVVLCHNDLLHNNIIYNKERDSVRFIDFEYAALNHLSFDIGNHFNEFAGVSPVDYSRYPKEELQRDWIRTYLQHFGPYNRHHYNTTEQQNYRRESEDLAAGREVTEQEVTRLHVHVCMFSLASNLFWGMWAILQAQLSNIDFDFTSYAAARLDFYFQKRDQYLSLDPDNIPDHGQDHRPDHRPDQKTKTFKCKMT